jgi:hypothetical protein
MNENLGAAVQSVERDWPTQCPTCNDELLEDGSCLTHGAVARVAPTDTPTHSSAPGGARSLQLVEPGRAGDAGAGEGAHTSPAPEGSEVPALIQVIAESGSVEIRDARPFVRPARTKWIAVRVEEWVYAGGELVATPVEFNHAAEGRRGIDNDRRRYVVVLEWRRFDTGELMRDIGPSFSVSPRHDDAMAITAARAWAKAQAGRLLAPPPHSVRKAREV